MSLSKVYTVSIGDRMGFVYSRTLPTENWTETAESPFLSSS